MPVSEIKGSNTIIVPAIGSSRISHNKFLKTLNSFQVNVKTATPVAIQQKETKTVGIITEENPTISHLLKSHPDYRQNYWEIIFSNINKGKKYTEIPEGSIVSINRETQELSWKIDNIEIRAASTLPKENAFVDSRAKQPQEPVIIGTINEKTPTVSHLLQNHPGFKHDFWDIIYSPVNKNKSYEAMKPGTKVSIDMETRELYFNSNSPPVLTASNKKHPPLQHHAISSSLDEVAKQYIGKPYDMIDCYGLIVKGLIDKGIQYNGFGGVKEQLKTLAKEKGLPPNTYLSGEGLVEHTGTTLYTKSIFSISDTQKETENLYEEMTPYLGKGLILSFSTHSRGHTGIVSRHEKDWTYVNSGDIDNEIIDGPRSKRVGEEFLKDEIKNWCRLAANTKESLKVTLGKIDETRF